jgi:hypothetical protein
MNMADFELAHHSHGAQERDSSGSTFATSQDSIILADSEAAAHDDGESRGASVAPAPSALQHPQPGLLAAAAADCARAHADTRSPEAIFAAASDGAGVEVPFRAHMEQSFGQSFAGVRAHLGQTDAMQALGAEAATVGETVAFGTMTPSLALVAHELAHVAQQRASGGAGGVALKSVSEEGDAAEREADQVAERVVAGERVSVAQAPSSTISAKRPPGVIYRDKPLSRADGDNIMQGLQRGDESVLAGLTMPSGFKMPEGGVLSSEWGLGVGTENDGAAACFILPGTSGAVQWSGYADVPVEEGGMKPIAHTHPIKDANGIDREVDPNQTVEALMTVADTKDIVASTTRGLVLPTCDDLTATYAFKTEHTVYTPYVCRFQGGKFQIVNPTSQNVKEPHLTFKLANVDLRQRGEQPVITGELTAYAGTTAIGSAVCVMDGGKGQGKTAVQVCDGLGDALPEKEPSGSLAWSRFPEDDDKAKAHSSTEASPRNSVDGPPAMHTADATGNTKQQKKTCSIQ